MNIGYQINTAEDLVKGFALLIHNKKFTLTEVHDFVLDCTDGDERLTSVTLEKVLTQLDFLQIQEQNVARFVSNNQILS